MPRKVVDTNQLRAPALRHYLASSKNNIAVLPDYTSMEAYRGADVEQLMLAMEILSDFPAQVLVLKSTLEIGRMRSREAGLIRRLIDEQQTAGFGEYCQQVRLARAGDAKLRSAVERHGREAAAFLDGRLLKVAPEFRTSMELVAQELFSEEELRSLRAAQPRPELSMGLKILASAFRMSGVLLSRVPTWPKTFVELRNSFPLRFALCGCTSMIDSVMAGGTTSADPNRTRNDMVDIGIAAYATYFDGLLSNDGKASRVHDHARIILDVVLRKVSGQYADELFEIAKAARHGPR